MNEPSNRDEQLERLIGRVLRDQPPRRAPSSLESKVFAEIAQRAAAPWWRSSFSHWPMAARIAFVLASVGVVKVTLDAIMWILTPLEPSVPQVALPSSVAWIHSLTVAAGAIFRGVPTLWIYGGLTLLTAMYIVLFGVSAAAYRTLYAHR
jgi:hypothetical protein